MTCFVSKSTVSYTADTISQTIGGFKSGPDINFEVVFGRETNTGTGTELPTDKREVDHSEGHTVAELLVLPGSTGKQRIGAFYCQMTKYGITEKIVAIVLSSTKSKCVRHLFHTIISYNAHLQYTFFYK